MKKKILTILLGTVLIIFLAGCSKTKTESKIGKESNKIITTNTDVTLSIKENTLTNTGATLILKNNSDEKYTYGNEYGIEIKQNNKWYELNTNAIFELPLFFIEEHESTEIELNWKYSYGNLKKGTYRLIKNIGSEDNTKKFNIAIEFNIE